MTTADIPPALVQAIARLAGIHATSPVLSAEVVNTSRHDSERLLEAGHTEGLNADGWLVQLQGEFALNRGPRGGMIGGRTMHAFLTAEGEVLDFGIGDRTFDLATLGPTNSLLQALQDGG